MVDLPVSGSLLIYSASALLFVGLLMLIFFITRPVGRIIRMRRRPVKRIGFIASTLRLLLILLLISASTALLLLGAFIRSYQNVTHLPCWREGLCYLRHHVGLHDYRRRDVDLFS